MRTFAVLIAAAVAVSTAVPLAQSDLERLMADVLARRDDNWKKLQQYTLNEDQTFRLLGPNSTPLFGTKREYVWVPRDGFFIRSPLRVDGVVIDDAERSRQEAGYLERERQRERRRAERAGELYASSAGVEPVDVPDVLRQSLEPQFVSAAYFMRFKFERGTYAFVGRERLLDRDVLKIEYYPERLFGGRRQDADKPAQDSKAVGKPESKGDKKGDQITRQMNKVTMVTLWVDPANKQILKYDFQNIDADFLPARWLVRLDEIRASMRMGNPFPDVWLPADVAIGFQMTLAIGTISASYDVKYRDHRLAETSVKVVQ